MNASILRSGAPAWLALLLAMSALPAQAGTWGAPRALQGPFAVVSPPEPPLVAMNRNGHALLAWADTGAVRYADKGKGTGWTPSHPAPGGGKSAGLVAVALGNNEVAALGFATAATRYEPSRLMVTLRLPGGSFGTPVEPVPGAFAWDIKLGVACDGSVTLLWNDTGAVWATRLAGTPGTGACNGTPGPGPWSPAVQLSNGAAGSGLADLATNDAGAALAVWQEGPWGVPNTIVAAWQSPDGVWQAAQTVSTGTGRQTWNPKPGLDAAGNAAVGYLDGNTMMVAQKAVGAGWSAPMPVSGSQSVYYPALAMSAQGDILAAWMSYDAGNIGRITARQMSPAGTWAAPQRLSQAAENADWPTAAFAPEGGLALVGWTDDNSNLARAAVWSAGSWKRRTLDRGWWGSVVPVAAGGGAAVAGWAQPQSGNVNSATLLSSTWE